MNGDADADDGINIKARRRRYDRFSISTGQMQAHARVVVKVLDRNL